MSLPPHTGALLGEDRARWTLPGVDDEECEGAIFHSPRPLFVQPTLLVLTEWWQKDKALGAIITPDEAPTAYLCGTCRDNLTVLLQMLYATNGDLDWEIRREFGNLLRGLATKGWTWFIESRPAESSFSPTKG